MDGQPQRRISVPPKPSILFARATPSNGQDVVNFPVKDRAGVMPRQGVQVCFGHVGRDAFDRVFTGLQFSLDKTGQGLMLEGILFERHAIDEHQSAYVATTGLQLKRYFVRDISAEACPEQGDITCWLRLCYATNVP